MIHVNVRPYKEGKEHGKGCVVETSTDGAGWLNQYMREEEEGHDSRREAEDIARIMGVAWSYAGVEWRGTSHGYGL